MTTQPNQPEQDAAKQIARKYATDIIMMGLGSECVMERTMERADGLILEAFAKLSALRDQRRTAEKPPSDGVGNEIETLLERLCHVSFECGDHGHQVDIWGGEIEEPKGSYEALVEKSAMLKAQLLTAIALNAAQPTPSSDALAVAIALLNQTQRDYHSSNSLGLYNDIRDFLARLKAASSGSTP